MHVRVVKPGRMSFPAASIVRVCAFARARISAFEPTATMRLPITATASAFGFAWCIVRTLALTMIKSAVRFCALV